MFGELPFLDRFRHAAEAGFKAVEYLFAYAYDREALKQQLLEHANALGCDRVNCLAGILPPSVDAVTARATLLRNLAY
jgi:hydroxypyruvate isomerase